MKERAQAKALDGQRQMMRSDSVQYAQRGKIIQVQQGLLQAAAKDLSRQKGKTTFWKIVASVAVSVGIVLAVR